MNRETIEYYNKNATVFATETMHVDFERMQRKFAEKVRPGAHILDFGCGSGRDTKWFLSNGFSVVAIDGSIELCKIASTYTGINVRHMYFRDLEELEVYDGIWACSSILHLTMEDLYVVIGKMAEALKTNGIIYTSFKYGDFEGYRNGRYFTNMDEDRIEKIISEHPMLAIEEMWITSDVRPGRGEEKWLNLILRKTK